MRLLSPDEFVAHTGNVNCLRIGPKSGRVMVTGGEDKRVNLWAIGKTNPVMSLSGHATSVTCATLDWLEEFVAAGSASGVLKLWDLTHSKVIRTLTGHKSMTTTVEFHPFGEFFASGSADRTIRVWDVRRKSCIQTYADHSDDITSLKISPDGRWIASGGVDSTTKIWDMTAGKLLHTFSDHTLPITSLAFHPHEFVLASASEDGTIRFYDLETFDVVSSTSNNQGSHPLLIDFHPDGKCILAGHESSLEVWTWEPAECLDTVYVNWSNVTDIKVLADESKLIGSSLDHTFVSMWGMNTKTLNLSVPTPNLAPNLPAPSHHGDAIASKEWPGSVPAESADNSWKSPSVQDHAQRASSGSRTPTPGRYADRAAPFPQPSREHTPTPPQRSVPVGLAEQRPGLIDQSSPFGPATYGPQYSQPAATMYPQPTPPQSSAFSIADQQRQQLGYPHLESQPVYDARQYESAPSRSMPGQSAETRAPGRTLISAGTGEKPLNLDVARFVQPRSSSPRPNLQSDALQFPEPQNEFDVIDILSFRNTSMMTLLSNRLDTLRMVRQQWDEQNIKKAIATVVSLRDPAVLVDILRIVNLKPKLLTLEICSLLLPSLNDLCCDIYEDYITVACTTIRSLCRIFSNIILTTLDSERLNGGVVDISHEERLKRCQISYDEFRKAVDNLDPLKRTAGHVGVLVRDTLKDLQMFI
ncbi:WD40-repeat-containing domain protein [Polychytrium aggregatum]|uniref:WD40-repeat-containing domain protein n=1 Tax=Polychytrium aggregatum TaxID=110093 RepID=UPI0022FEE54E|nr:WD40-repeat-containing domain protein [Polychytrium aggregatum]KAI9203512.1 WD40-repeat-containing domain protein [Polychytrium aggregatum]